MITSELQVVASGPSDTALSAEAQRFAMVVRCVFAGMLTLCVVMLAVHG